MGNIYGNLSYPTGTLISFTLSSQKVSVFINFGIPRKELRAAIFVQNQWKNKKSKTIYNKNNVLGINYMIQIYLNQKALFYDPHSSQYCRRAGPHC